MILVGGFFIYSFFLFALGALFGALVMKLWPYQPSSTFSPVNEDPWLFQPRLELIVDNTSPKDAA